MKEQMIGYLQEQFTRWNEEAERYGMDDRIVEKQLDALIANKEMVEALIGQPVNLQKDGKVTIG